MSACYEAGVAFGLTYSDKAPPPLSSSFRPWLLVVQDLAIDCISAQIDVCGERERVAVRQGVLAGIVDGCVAFQGGKNEAIRSDDRVPTPISEDESCSSQPVARSLSNKDRPSLGSSGVLRLDYARIQDARSQKDGHAGSRTASANPSCGPSLVARFVDLGRVTREFTEEIARDRPRPAIRMALEVAFRVSVSDALDVLESIDMWTEGGNQ